MFCIYYDMNAEDFCLVSVIHQWQSQKDEVKDDIQRQCYRSCQLVGMTINVVEKSQSNSNDTSTNWFILAYQINIFFSQFFSQLVLFFLLDSFDCCVCSFPHKCHVMLLYVVCIQVWVFYPAARGSSSRHGVGCLVAWWESDVQGCHLMGGQTTEAPLCSTEFQVWSIVFHIKCHIFFPCRACGFRQIDKVFRTLNSILQRCTYAVWPPSDGSPSQTWDAWVPSSDWTSHPVAAGRASCRQGQWSFRHSNLDI